MADLRGETLALLHQDAGELRALVLIQVGVVAHDLGKGPQGGERGQKLVTGGRERRIVGQMLADDPQILARLAIKAIELRDRAAKLRLSRHELLKVHPAQPKVGKDLIAEHLLQTVAQARLASAREQLDVDAAGFGESPRQIGGDLTSIVLDQVQIAGRNLQFFCHRHLGQPQLATILPDLRP